MDCVDRAVRAKREDRARRSARTVHPWILGQLTLEQAFWRARPCVVWVDPPIWRSNILHIRKQPLSKTKQVCIVLALVNICDAGILNWAEITRCFYLLTPRFESCVFSS